MEHTGGEELAQADTVNDGVDAATTEPSALDEADTVLDTPREDERAHATWMDMPAPGTRIGRFEVGSELGSGGMGVVFSARDPELERSVAIKLVRTGAKSGPNGELQQRLVREARAMAQIRHPNVLTVYEAGTDLDRVFVAMEQVDGGTLRDVQYRYEGDWRRLVELYAAAGRGLAAAHSAGMVHRDFKPDNVMVEGDRVLVADFGLVGASPLERGDLRGNSLLGDGFTRTGTMMGTPAYMAPEQHVGEPSPSSDQFSFCVSLYEALYGELPFPGDTVDDYFAAIAAGAVKPAPANDPVPPWIRDALVRGLSVDPKHRFASMKELVATLAADPDRHRAYNGVRRMAVTFVVTALGVWVLANALADQVMTYRLMVESEGVALVMLAGVALLLPKARAVAFNRRLLYLAGSALLAAAAATLGGWLAGLPPIHTALFHLLTAACIAAPAAVLLDSRLIGVAAAYAAAFLVAAAWPQLFYAATLSAHAVFAVVCVLAFGSAEPLVADDDDSDG